MAVNSATADIARKTVCQAFGVPPVIRRAMTQDKMTTPSEPRDFQISLSAVLRMNAVNSITAITAKKDRIRESWRLILFLLRFWVVAVPMGGVEDEREGKDVDEKKRINPQAHIKAWDVPGKLRAREEDREARNHHLRPKASAQQWNRSGSYGGDKKK